MLFTVFERFTTTCVSSAKKSVSFFSTAAGRAPPADESIHSCSRDKSGVSIPSHTDVVITRPNFSLQPLVFHRHRLRNAECNIQRVSSEAPGIRTTTRSVSGMDLFEMWTGVKLRIQNTQSRKSHDPPSFVRKYSPSQL